MYNGFNYRERSGKAMNVIKTDSLVKFYGRSRGIDGINLQVEEGDFFGFIGPNGARYILKVISTISAPTSTGIRA